jgi:hypothetical protein
MNVKTSKCLDISCDSVPMATGCVCGFPVPNAIDWEHHRMDISDNHSICQHEALCDNVLCLDYLPDTLQ